MCENVNNRWHANTSGSGHLLLSHLVCAISALTLCQPLAIVIHFLFHLIVFPFKQMTKWQWSCEKWPVAHTAHSHLSPNQFFQWKSLWPFIVFRNQRFIKHIRRYSLRRVLTRIRWYCTYVHSHMDNTILSLVLTHCLMNHIKRQCAFVSLLLVCSTWM